MPISYNTDNDNLHPSWHPLGEPAPERPEKEPTDMVIAQRLEGKARGGGSRIRHKHIKQAAVIEALRNALGMKTMAARALGCSLGVVQSYCQKYPAVQAECQAQLETLIDKAHLQLSSAVSRGEQWAVTLVLKTLGRDRGFTERTEVTGRDGGPIEHTHIHQWEERLQAAHKRMADQKAAIQLEKQAGGGYGQPEETA